MSKFVLGLIPALLAISSTARAADASPWKVSEVSGDVKVVDGGRSRAAVKGTLLASGAVIAAGTGARAVLVHDKDFVIVSPNSRIRITPAEQQRGIFQIISEFGTSLFTIEHKATPHFGVQTPYLAAVVKGTVFSVTVGATGASVQVTRGAVDVATLDGGAHELIRPGMIASVGAADRFQLRIDGDGSRTIRSPGAPPAGTASTSAPGATAAPTASAAPAEASAAPAVVAAPVAAAPVSLADVTRGLVQGNNSLALASANVSKGETARRDNGASGGSGGGSGSGAGAGNGGSGSSGGSGNAGGSGSGSGSGKPDDSGSGSGSGGSGNGNGNGNGNPDNSNSSDAGKGNGGSGNGNDNGNGNSGGSNGGSGGDKGDGGTGNSNGGGSDDKADKPDKPDGGAGGNSGGNGNGNSGNGNGNGGGSDGKTDKPDKPDKPDDKGKGLIGGLIGTITAPVPGKPPKGD
jgi:hypothetical protein